MIDRVARDQLAEAIRALGAGLISNDQFEDRLPRASQDPAIFEVFFNGPWQIYDDCRQHKLTGRYRLTPENKAVVARWVLFLKSDLEYAWPRLSSFSRILSHFFGLITLGLSSWLWRSKFCRAGDVSVWPFISKADYEQALASPPYFWKTH